MPTPELRGSSTQRLRLVDATTTPLLLKTVVSVRLRPARLITQHLRLPELISAYDTCANAQASQALKVVLTND